MSAENPETGREWFARGLEQQTYGFHREAVQAFEQAIALDGAKSATTFNCALSSAALHDAEHTKHWVAQALPFFGRGTEHYNGLLELHYMASTGFWSMIELPVSLNDL